VLRGQRTNRRGHNGRAKPDRQTTIDSRAHTVSSDAQESKGDAGGQMMGTSLGRAHDRAHRLCSLRAPHKPVKTRIDVSKKSRPLHRGRRWLQRKKPSSTRKKSRRGAAEIGEVGTHLTPQSVPDHCRTDLARHSKRNARRIVACLRSWRHQGHHHGATTDPTTAPPQFLERAAITNSPDQADRRRRPLSRRERNTLRPARVDMRDRKPCFFARRRLLGWNVRFTRGLRDLVSPTGSQIVDT